MALLIVARSSDQTNNPFFNVLWYVAIAFVVVLSPLFHLLPLGGGLPLFVFPPGLKLAFLALAVRGVTFDLVDGGAVVPALEHSADPRGTVFDRR